MAVTKRKRKKNPYRAEVFVSGVRVASQSFPTAASAHKWQEETKRRYESGRGPLLEMTLGELLRRFEKQELHRLAPSSQLRYRQVLTLIGESPTAEVQLENLDSRAIDRLLDWLLAHPKAQSKNRQSFRIEMLILKVVLTWFREEEDEAFVVPVTRRHMRKAMFKEVAARDRDFFIPPEKIRPWLDALGDAADPVYRDLAVVQLVLGLRIGELCSLCWDVVDFERSQITVRRNMEWRTAGNVASRNPVDRTKTASSVRTLPFPAVVREALLAAKRRQPLSTLVFRNATGREVGYGAVLAQYNRAFKAVGIEWTGTHICRHTNGTLGSADGRLEETRLNLGHTSEEQTRRYAKIHAMLKNTVPDRVAKFVEGGADEVHAQDHAQLAVPGEKSNG